MIRLIHLYFTLEQPFTEAAYTFDYLTKVFGFLSDPIFPRKFHQQ